MPLPIASKAKSTISIKPALPFALAREGGVDDSPRERMVEAGMSCAFLIDSCEVDALRK
jgi:hypothetical protein